MPMWMRPSVMATLCMAGFASSVSLAGPSGGPTCAGGQISIPDERSEGPTLCLDAAEWEKAKAICAGIAAETGEAVDPLECICQDGDSVGACGD